MIGLPLRVTRAGMVAERLTYAFWPFWTLALLAIAALAFGFQDWAPLELFWAAALVVPVALAWTIWRGLRRLRWPSEEEAAERLDRTLAGRPLAALSDDLAIGSTDDGARAVWSAHLRRMAGRLASLKPVAPDIRLAGRDPFALRYLAVIGLVMAALFGSLWRVTDIVHPTLRQTDAATQQASWEGWVEPPPYAGQPAIYLNSQKGDRLDVLEGSRLTLRLYGAEGALVLSQTLGDVQPETEAPGSAKPADMRTGAPRVTNLVITRSGTLEIAGEGGRSWTVAMQADAPPTISLTGPMDRKAKGNMAQPFKATDDYGVVKGEARFELDLGAIDRRYGLAPDPETQAPLVYALPMPVSGSRKDFDAILAEDASQHPWANLPVRMTLTVTDGAGHVATTGAQPVILPGRRFFDPLGAALIEMRRDLLWSGIANGPRTAQILKAITWKPEGFIPDSRTYLKLRMAIRRLDQGANPGPLPVSLRDETAKVLWDVATQIEDGGLDDALARMQQAQERLSEAIRNGASDDEIQKLMDELKRATDDYLRMLAEKGKEDPTDKFAKNQKSQTVTQDQIQQMMDEIERLMKEGRKAEAQAMLDQLNQLMQNLKVTQGQGGEGQGSGGDQAMRDLRQTLRDQQALSDDTFRQNQRGGQGGQGGMGMEGQMAPGGEGQTGQDQFGQNQPGQEGQQPGLEGQDQGNNPGERGQNGMQADQGQGGEQGRGQTEGQVDGQALAERQRALRDALRRHEGGLPDAQGQDGDRARRSFGDAGRAMDEAEQALREDDLRGAINRQAEALRNLREGMRAMNEALAQQKRNRDGMTGENGKSEAEARDGGQQRDPLGRSEGRSGNTGTDRNMLPGRDVYGRARDLLDEIRRRSSEQNRPGEERDYLRRLLGPY